MRSSAGDPALLPVHILSTEIGARRLASIDLVDGLLERIRAADPKLGHQPASGYAVESLGPQNGAYTRRIEQRLGRRRRGRFCTLGGRHRYRRLGAVAGVLVRAQRPQDDDRSCQHLWDFAIEPDP